MNVEPQIFEMNPNESDEVQDQHYKIENRRSLRQKSHKNKANLKLIKLIFNNKMIK